MYPPDDDEGVLLWRASLEGDFAAPSVELAYDNDEIILAGYGSRFGDLPGAVDHLGPVGFIRLFPLFTLKLPIGQVPNRATREYNYAELEKHLVPTDRDTPPEVAYVRVPGLDRYQYRDDSQGVRWFLAAYDLRARFIGHVTRVRRTVRKREFKGVVVKLHHQSAFTVSVPPEAIERNDEGIAVPKKGALVDVVVDVTPSLDGLTVGRLWHWR